MPKKSASDGESGIIMVAAVGTERIMGRLYSIGAFRSNLYP